MNEDVIFCYAMLSLASIATVVVAVRQYIRYRAAKRTMARLSAYVDTAVGQVDWSIDREEGNGDERNKV